MQWWLRLERTLLVLGMVLLGIFCAARLYTVVFSYATVQAFKGGQTSSDSGTADSKNAKPDFSLWSPQRVKGYEESLTGELEPAIGILRIPKIRLEVAVLEGTNEWSLNRGVGRIAGTAQLGEQGNVGIAGHRDGFFRGLKDIGPGDKIEVETPDQTQVYVVDQITVVDPKNVSVLAPRSRPSLTLVTCYPFYFLGSAPQRYIVEASIVETRLAKVPDSKGSVTASKTTEKQPSR